MMRYIAPLGITLAISALLASAGLANAASPIVQSAPAGARIIVKLRDTTNVQVVNSIAGPAVYSSNAQLNQVLQQLGVNHLTPLFPSIALKSQSAPAAVRASNHGLDRIHIFNVGPLGLQESLRALKANTAVEYAEPDYPTHTTALNDPYLNSTGTWGQTYADLWGVSNIGAPAAWARATGTGVLVAVVDTGVNIGHEDIAANITVNSGEIPGNGIDDDANGYIDDVNGWNFHNGNNNISDGYGHGTHVAGTIAAVGNNGLGVTGVAYGARILVVKTMGDSGEGFDSAGAQGIVYAADRGAKVISNSWGSVSSKTIDDAVRYAHAKGAVVIAAAGNDYGVDIDTKSPAGAPYAVAVSASTPSNQFANFSNVGLRIDVAAPGVDVLSLLAPNSVFAAQIPGSIVGSKYLRLSGTSMATPHVAGLAALLLSQQPTLTPEQIRYWLRNGAADLGNTGFDKQFGYGKINADNSLQLASAGTAPAVSGEFTKQLKGKFIASGTLTIYGEAGGAGFSSYELAYSRLGATGPFTTFKTSQLTVSGTDSILGTVDPTGFLPGNYVLRLRVKAANGTYLDYFDHVSFDSTIKPGWPQTLSTTGWSGPESWEYEAVLIDLDGNGSKEIVIPTAYSIHALNANGTAYPGFPYFPGNTCSQIAGSVTAADLNGDGKPELVFPCWPTRGKGTINAIDNQGRLLAGFPSAVISSSAFNGLPTPDSVVRGHLSVADVNSDGKPEIIAAGILLSDGGAGPQQGFVTVINGQGQTLSGWPQFSQTFANNADITLTSERASLADVDRDGIDEIVVNNFSGTASLTIFKANGQLVRTINTSTQFKLMFDPIFADINGDGIQEFVSVGCSTNFEIGATAISSTGQTLSGWPRWVTGAGMPCDALVTPHTVIDLNQDSKLELILGVNGSLHALDHLGAELSGWPKNLGQTFQGTNISVATIGSNSPSLIFQVDHQLMAVDKTGTALPGWPKGIPSNGLLAPIAGVLDNPSKVAIIANVTLTKDLYDSQLVIYEENLTNSSLPASCPMYRCNNKRSGAIAPTVVNYNKVYNQVYVRGTNNAWAITSPMTLVANNTWEVTTTFGSTTTERFKFDINGDWAINFGDTNKDGIADSVGSDILISQGAGSYKVRFNDSSKVYTVTKLGAANQAPVANAGPDQSITSSTAASVTLNGAASTDSDGSITTYAWDEMVNSVWQAVATGPTPTLSNVSVGQHRYRLTVTDNQSATASDEVIVTIAAAGFTKVYNQVYVRGTNNAWAITSPMSLVANNTWEVTTTFGSTSTERFKFDINGDWVTNFGDTNKDGIADSAGSDILISLGAGSYKVRFNDSTKAYTVTKLGATNQVPVANAGPDQAITSATATSVTLSGNGSSDPDGTITSYAWDEMVNSAWQAVATGVNPTLSNVSVGQHRYRLTVTDNQGASATDEVIVTIAAGGFTKVYNQVLVRGTNNAWATTSPMALVANNTWEITVAFGSTASERFKFDINGDWVTNFGDTNKDGIADATGSDILISQGVGNYKIRFNDSTKVYTVVKQ